MAASFRREHGFPVRAIVPGWYAMASVKWLQRIIVTDQPFTGYYQTLDYAYWKRRGDIAELTPLTEMQIKDANREAGSRRNRSGKFQCACSRRRVDERCRNHKSRTEHRWRSDLERDKFAWRIETKRVAALGIQLANPATGKANSNGSSHRFTRPNATGAARPRSRNIYDQSSVADRGRGQTVAAVSDRRTGCSSYATIRSRRKLQDCAILLKFVTASR